MSLFFVVQALPGSNGSNVSAPVVAGRTSPGRSATSRALFRGYPVWMSSFFVEKTLAFFSFFDILNYINALLG